MSYYVILILSPDMVDTALGKNVIKLKRSKESLLIGLRVMRGLFKLNSSG